jgi:hypothetical protein
MAMLSPLYPTKPVDVSERLRPLPQDGTVPGMPVWRWLHTPGHSPGHVSLWREADRMLVAGDAFITARQESAYASVTQAPEMHGPPMYLTPDWESARSSVQSLASLEPETVVTGHGQAMRGPKMRAALNELACRFDEVAVPPGGAMSSGSPRAESNPGWLFCQMSSAACAGFDQPGYRLKDGTASAVPKCSMRARESRVPDLSDLITTSEEADRRIQDLEERRECCELLCRGWCE